MGADSYNGSQMRRHVLNSLVTVGAFLLGILAILRGRFLLSICFAGLGLLRGVILFQGLRPRKPHPSIRLNIEGDSSH
jgi:hypothetical protein